MSCIFANFSSILYGDEVRMDEEYYNNNREWLIPYFERYYPNTIKLYQSIEERLQDISAVIQDVYNTEVLAYRNNVCFNALLSKATMHELYPLRTRALVLDKLQRIASQDTIPVCGECGASPVIVELIKYTYFIYFVDSELLFTKGGGKMLAAAINETPANNIPQILINMFGA